MVKIEVRGLEAALSVVESMAARGRHTAPLMRHLGMIMLQSTAQNFEAGGRPEPWKPWSPLTRKVYEGQAVARARATGRWQRAGERGRRSIERRYVERWVGGAKILHRSGDLKKSIVLGRVTDAYVEIGSSLPYARIHQLGGVVRPKNTGRLFVPAGDGFLLLRQATIPARPFLVFQDEDRRAVVLAARDYLVEGRV
ncbi:MAG: phage virion morphogenesis protein [Bacillota bacterium]|nr:phage virion morphogenesis protein [Bacillota bacterium]